MLKLVLTDREVNGGESHLFDDVSRYASRGVVQDDDGRVALMHLTVKNLYKLPGGGFEANEDKFAAFFREVKEETGFDAEILSELGYTDEHKAKAAFYQRSYCFWAKKKAGVQQQDLTRDEESLGFTLKWFDIDTAIVKMEESVANCTDYSMQFMMKRDLEILKYTLAANFI